MFKILKLVSNKYLGTIFKYTYDSVIINIPLNRLSRPGGGYVRRQPRDGQRLLVPPGLLMRAGSHMRGRRPRPEHLGVPVSGRQGR